MESPEQKHVSKLERPHFLLQEEFDQLAESIARDIERKLTTAATSFYGGTLPGSVLLDVERAGKQVLAAAMARIAS